MRRVIRWIIGGLIYGALEIVWRGYTHWTMILLAAFICIPLDIANNHIPWKMPIWLQAIIGGLTVTIAEFCTGLIVNVWLNLGVWDYSEMWGNVLGQICPQFTALWIPLAGVMIVIFDFIDYFQGGDRPRYTL